MGAIVLVKKYRCVHFPCEGQAHSDALVSILCFMMVRVCPRQQKSMYDGI